jgi:DMSO reductase anchor subunit
MHPAYSVIIFTTASGAGYGLLFWLSLTHALGLLPQNRWLAFVSLALALALITTGLLASTLHLGHPERALGAFSQWRSSWLSREGVAAVATYIPAGLLALIWLIDAEITAILTVLLALLAAMGAIVTVYCTGMIYASLRTIRQWHLGLVPLVYLALAAATGALLLTGLCAVFGYNLVWPGVIALLSLALAAALKLAYWRRIDATVGQYTVEMATGLGQFGAVRPLDPPHTRPNFVMREMGYSIARKHAKRLRIIALTALFAVPALLLLLGLTSGWVTLFSLLAVLISAVGIVLERWLFFAEAEHVSQLYYGAQRA